ncbi:MAG: S8 family serine peptidase [Actinobacteria bacterium]|nr:S8 family serine peptidase [Actinomycetota bacterium]
MGVEVGAAAGQPSTEPVGPSASAGGATGDEQVPGLVVKYAPNVVVPQAAGAAVPGATAQELDLISGDEVGLGWYEADLPSAVSVETAEEYAQRLTADPAIEYAEPQLWMRPTAAVPDPDDPLWSQQWGFASYGDDTFVTPPTLDPLTAEVVGTNLLPALGAPRGDAPVVAVIDTGIANHPDLTAQATFGYNFISSPARAGNTDGRGPDAADTGDWVTQQQAGELPFGLLGCAAPDNSSWHGTHVTGTIAAVTNNDLGVAGTAPVSVQTLRALGRCGGSSGDIAAAMLWAAGGVVPGVPANSTPARVVNMSLGGPGQCPQHYQEVIDFGRAQGTVYVVAAGNDNADAANSAPASCDGVITVAATTPYGARTSFSNYGDVVDIAAPGQAILSTLNAGLTVPAEPNYANYNGTSMATPHVAGAVALLLAAEPDLTPDQVAARLANTATPFKQTAGGVDNPSFDCVGDDPCGAGYLDTAALLGQETLPPPVVAARFSVAPVTDAVAPNTGNVEVTVGFEPPRGRTDSYRIEVWRAGTPVVDATTTQTSAAFVVQGDPGDDYEVRVTPLRDGSGGVISEAMRVPSIAPSVPATPTIAGVSANDTTAVVDVSNTFSTPEPTATVVTAQPGGATCEITELPSAGSCAITGLTPGTTYTFTAVARNPIGDSAPSAPVTATPSAFAPPTAPGAPTVVLQGRTASLSWTPSVPAQGRTIASYAAVADPQGTLQQCVTQPQRAATAWTSCEMANLIVGETYRFRVQATDDTGKSSVSELSAPVVVGGTAVPPSAPDSPPTIVTGDGQVTASITTVEGLSKFNGGSPLIAMRVIASPGGASCDIAADDPESACVIAGLTNGQPYTFTSVGVNALGISAPSMPTMPFTPGELGAEFIPLADSVRVFDSRASGGPVPSGVPQVVDVQAPDGAVAVAYNLTVTSPTSAGHAVVGPAGVALPKSSTINWFAPGQTFANGYVSALGDGGAITVEVAGGTAEIVVDVVGYYLPAGVTAAAVTPANGTPTPGVFVPLAPSERAYDSRAADGPIAGGESREVDLSSVVPAGATAVAYTVTEFDTVGSGHLSVGLPGSPKPATSTINWFKSGQRVANSSVAGIDDQRSIAVFAGGGRSNFTIDVLGYFTSAQSAPEGLRFTPIVPARAYDSRVEGAGGLLFGGQRRVTSAVPTSVTPPPGTAAMVFNLTEVGTVGNGHLRVAAGDTAVAPDTSVINWYQSEMRTANGSTAAVTDGVVTTFARGGATQYLIDVAGYYH